ncbi:MAG: DUF1292 domain-containing protein [Lachnospiraceae bacterium]|nr:DUF1292 domain-containing protein [Lachnospiraceae bacterium]
MSDKEKFDAEDEELDQVILTLEDDSELVCDVIAYFPCDGKNYVALLPADDPDSDFFLYRYEERGEEIELIDIESDDEFDAASEAFSELLDEEEFGDILDDEE